MENKILKYILTFLFVLSTLQASVQYENFIKEKEKFEKKLVDLKKIKTEELMLEASIFAEHYSKYLNNAYNIVNTSKQHEHILEKYIISLEKVDIKSTRNKFNSYEELKQRYFDIKVDLLNILTNLKAYSDGDFLSIKSSINKLTIILDELSMESKTLLKGYREATEKLNNIGKINILYKEDLLNVIGTNYKNLLTLTKASVSNVQKLSIRFDKTYLQLHQDLNSILHKESMWNKYKELIIALLGLFGIGSISIYITKNKWSQVSGDNSTNIQVKKIKNLNIK